MLLKTSRRKARSTDTISPYWLQILTTAGILGKGPKQKALLLPLQATNSSMIGVMSSRVGRGRFVCLRRKVWRPLNFCLSLFWWQIILILLIFPCRDYTEKNMPEKDDNKASILSTLSDIENSGFDVLLQQLFAQLKVPYPEPTLPSPWLSVFSCPPLSFPNLLIQMQQSSEGLWGRSPPSISQKTLNRLELVLMPAGRPGTATEAWPCRGT